MDSIKIRIQEFRRNYGRYSSHYRSVIRAWSEIFRGSRKTVFADVIEHIAVKDFTTCLVLRMRGVTALDSTAMNALIDMAKACEKRGITVVFSHVNKQPMKVMDKVGFIERIGKENFQTNIRAALQRAEEVIAK